MSDHHLILGSLVDFITGETIEDTHDERYRQKLAHLLVETKGFFKEEIKLRHDFMVKAGNKTAVVKVDFLVSLSGKVCMIIKYGPGSLVTRHRLSIAVSRLVAPYQVPVVVVTNGKDAEIIDGFTGKVTGSGFDAIPSRQELTKQAADHLFETISLKRTEKESRILYAFEVDGSCFCDKGPCKL
ncbi:MAG: type I restriction enzyme HsdR N-terminal domain-containing protein [Deltaproteobacteria bacterium]|nr:type I restriction enzyme HsdR N-terminal domain-containing protein [Deltaproteobacteria bacterium]